MSVKQNAANIVHGESPLPHPLPDMRSQGDTIPKLQKPLNGFIRFDRVQCLRTLSQWLPLASRPT